MRSETRLAGCPRGINFQPDQSREHQMYSPLFDFYRVMSSTLVISQSLVWHTVHPLRLLPWVCASWLLVPNKPLYTLYLDQNAKPNFLFAVQWSPDQLQTVPYRSVQTPTYTHKRWLETTGDVAQCCNSWRSSSRNLPFPAYSSNSLSRS